MNVLHLEASSGWGGQEIRILREAEGMANRGHLVILAVMSGGGLIKEARKKGFKVIEMNFKKWAWPITLFRLFWLIYRFKIDIINTHSSLDSWIGGIAGRLSGKIIIRTRHLSSPIKKGLNSWLLYGKLADFVVTTCARIIPTISSQSGKELFLFRSIPTGVDPSLLELYRNNSSALPQHLKSQSSFDHRQRSITPNPNIESSSSQIADFSMMSDIKTDISISFREKLNILPGDFLIGTACFMRSWKGINDFLEAAHLLRDVSHIKWVIIGGGHAESYRKKARELRLEKQVIFTGHLENPFPAIASLDLFALLSTAHEGVSQAILQAAFLGKPLIATDVGGLSEVCLHRKTGLQVSTFSPRSVADAVLEFEQNRLFCREAGENARQLVETQFTLSSTIDQMEQVYLSLLKRESN